MLQTFQPEILLTIYLKPEHWAAIREGLEGMPVREVLLPEALVAIQRTLAGKTGSSEIGRGTVLLGLFAIRLLMLLKSLWQSRRVGRGSSICGTQNLRILF